MLETECEMTILAGMTEEAQPLGVIVPHPPLLLAAPLRRNDRAEPISFQRVIEGICAPSGTHTGYIDLHRIRSRHGRTPDRRAGQRSAVTSLRLPCMFLLRSENPPANSLAVFAFYGPRFPFAFKQTDPRPRKIDHFEIHGPGRIANTPAGRNARTPSSAPSIRAQPVRSPHPNARFKRALS